MISYTEVNVKGEIKIILIVELSMIGDTFSEMFVKVEIVKFCVAKVYNTTLTKHI